MRSIKIKRLGASSDILRVEGVLRRRLAERWGDQALQGTDGYTVELAVRPGIGTEGFCISQTALLALEISPAGIIVYRS